MKRAREMQNRSRLDTIPVPPMPQRQNHNEPSKESQSNNVKAQSEPAVSVPNNAQHGTGNFVPVENKKNPSGGIFDLIMRDKEKTLILCLILILMDEKTDNNLLIALLYLLI